MERKKFEWLCEGHDSGFLTDEEFIREVKASDITLAKEVKHRRRENRFKRWTPQEVKLIKDLREQGMSYSKIAKRIGRTKNGVVTRFFNYAADTKPKRRKSPWTKEDDDFIVKNYGKIPTKDIAKFLNRGYSALGVRVFELRKRGVKISRRSKKDKDWVQVGENKYPKHYSQMG